MRIRRIIGREWKAIVAIPFLAVLLAASVHQLYKAWAFGTISSGIFSSSYEAEPMLFGAIVGMTIVVSIVLAALVIGPIYGWAVEERLVRKRASQPTLDDARREPLDRQP